MNLELGNGLVFRTIDNSRSHVAPRNLIYLDRLRRLLLWPAFSSDLEKKTPYIHEVYLDDTIEDDIYVNGFRNLATETSRSDPRAKQTGSLSGAVFGPNL
ncbi:hypothetical protein TNCV_3835581 [Trichonephila clavipes]|nr:hypothetical protein TNCV_3835581 [Trichonephila clavipes]